MRKVLKWVITILVIGGIAAAAFAANRYVKSRPLAVKAAAAKKSTIVESVSASGDLEPRSTVMVVSPAEGKITKVYVKQGQSIEEDDHVIKIEDYGKVDSPYDGTIIDIKAQVGSYLARGKQIATLADLKPLYIVADVDESDIAKVKTGQKVTVIFDSYPDAKARGVVSSIGMISKRTESGGTAFPVKIRITSMGGAKIRLGMSADSEIEVARKTGVITVPIEAVDEHGSKDVVFVISGDKAKIRTVKLGLATETEYEIASGIEPGEKIAITQLNNLKDGTKVSVK